MVRQIGGDGGYRQGHGQRFQDQRLGRHQQRQVGFASPNTVRRRRTDLADVVLVSTPAFLFGASPIEFDKLTRFVARHQTLTSTLPPAAQTPALYIKSIIDMDVQITETTKREKDSKKKMNAANAKGLNGMKQKVKKQLREFENAVNAYRAVSRIAGVGSGRGPVQN